MAKLRIAVIGAGLIGMKHVELLARDGTLAAVVDPTEAGPAAAARFGCAHFADVEACLAAMTPDGAVVATPNHTHVPLAKVLVGAGVPVLIEKPIADASGTAKELVEFAKARAVAKAGVSGQVLLDVFSTSSAGCGVVNNALEKIIDRQFEGTGSHINTMHKDLTISMGLGEDLGVPLHTAAAAMQIFHAGKVKYPNGDNWVCTRVIEEIVGAELHREGAK